MFLACLDSGSVSRAATGLGVQQSTISRRLGTLESRLGASLFVRASTGIRPTELALAFEEDARAMQEHFQALQRLALGNEPAPEGKVRISLVDPMAVYILLPRLAGFSARYPNIHLELNTSYQTSDLTRGEADIAIRFFRPTSGDLITRRLATLPLAVLASEQYINDFGAPSLVNGRWVSAVLPGISTPEEAWMNAHVEGAPWLTTSSYVLASEAILQGRATGLGPTSLTLHDSRVRAFDVGIAPPEPLELWLTAHSALRKVPRIAAVWDWLYELFEELRDMATD